MAPFLNRINISRENFFLIFISEIPKRGNFWGNYKVSVTKTKLNRVMLVKNWLLRHIYTLSSRVIFPYCDGAILRLRLSLKKGTVKASVKMGLQESHAVHFLQIRLCMKNYQNLQNQIKGIINLYTLSLALYQRSL